MNQSFTDEIIQALPGWTWVYHVGFLACDRWRMMRSEDGGWKLVAWEPVDALANKVLALSEKGYALLTQLRLGPDRWAYRVTRSRKGY